MIEHSAALLVAIKKEQIQKVKQLTTASTINSQDSSSGLSPLSQAVLNHSLEIVKLLLERGAKVSISDSKGRTALHHAADISDSEIVELLLLYKASPNAQSFEGETPLHMAAYRGDSCILELLLKYEGDPNIANFAHKRTPLHYAAIIGNFQCLQVLIQNHADCSLEDWTGHKPCDLACHEVATIIDSLVRNQGEMLTIMNKEPDQEIAFFHRKTELAPLYDFLSGIHLEKYFENLVHAGFDDLSSMYEQMKTPVPLNENMLKDIGIDKPGHYKRILMRLNTNAVKEQRVDTSPIGLSQWLKDIKLENLYQNFVDAGYDDLQFLKEHIYSKYTFNEHVLTNEVHVERPGHRIRILGKLLEEANFERYVRTEIAEKGCECNLI